ncbi:MAG: sulfurtransferase TusA family protein [Lachnospiraceae bacterium]|nr:sulfurtransferase TusA family protein [Lachnospiraceae bacterium]
MAEPGFTVNDRIDITDVTCPITFVKTKVALEELEEGEILQVHLNSGEPAKNVPRSVKEEGHEILRFDENGDGTYELYIKKVGD